MPRLVVSVHGSLHQRLQSARWRRVCGNVMAALGLAIVTASLLGSWQDEGTGGGFDGQPLHGAHGGIIVTSYVGDGDSTPVPGPGYALIVGVLFLVWGGCEIGLLLRGGRASPRVGLWLGLTSLASADFAADLEGSGVRWWTAATLPATVLMIVNWHLERRWNGVGSRRGAWGWLPLALLVLAGFLFVTTFSSEPTLTALLLVAGSCAALGACVSVGIEVLSSASSVPRYGLIPTAFALFVGLLVLGLSTLSGLMA